MAGDFYLQQAADVVRHGGVIAYPTEAVYGLGCDPANEQAVMRLLCIKHRPVEKGLILLGASLSQLLPWIELSSEQQQQLQQQWPLGTTYLVSASPRVPVWITGAHHKVAVRVSGHPLAARLAQLAGTPLVSTSANRAGAPSCRNALQVGRQIGAELDFLVTGQCDVTRKPSTIVDIDSGDVVRN